MLGAANAAKEGSHIGFSLLTDHLPQSTRKGVVAVTMMAAVFFCGYLLIYGAEMVRSEMASGQKTPAIGWPEWVFGLTIPVGAVLLMVHFVEYALTRIFQKDGKRQ
jgi:TRAP-type C4-dicarboxylate transport system permease small subunit